MDIKFLSTKYYIKQIKEEDLQDVYELCESNPQYYKYCPPAVTKEAIKEDIVALPDGKTPKDKYYLGFYDGNSLVAVSDLITNYPNNETAFIGFFMINHNLQGQGVGTSIITEICEYFKKLGFSIVKLGYAKGNIQSESFWVKNNFVKTGQEIQLENYIVVSMQRNLI